ncbi:glycoside hydrolase [Rhizobium sp. CFBP 8762]|uniref:family 4 glycosyl hydrolase n=1 Tax=Rhizobium sp. CFBP 8762 TaxID=2775279 RepID=UPI00177BB111|nr:glycoside hydrolase [Rhizobium sp. CFBP 8762]MBD8555064.1 glycoside hydrolase [Rhizobium sp. CFBP 8762]
MARIKIAYIGGGSTRAPGCIACWIAQGDNFRGSEIVLIDIDKDRLETVRVLAQKMSDNAGVDITFTATTDRAAGLTDCDAVLTSFRPGGFEARYLDECIPLKHGVIGQETQGPGGFFMALRSIHAMKDIVKDMERVCPRARLFNYTNPVNIVAEAMTHYTDIPIVSLCEGPIVFPAEVAVAAGLDPSLLKSQMIGLNHASWSVEHLYDGQDFIPLVEAAWNKKRHDQSLDLQQRRLLHMTVALQAIPSQYFKYYYFRDEILLELQQSATTRAQDIMAKVPGYWQHYEEQARADVPKLDSNRIRGSLEELEIAIDVLDAVYNDRGEIWPVNVPNRGAIPDLADDLVVELSGYVDKAGIKPVVAGPLPPQSSGLVHMLAEYQAATARVALNGNRRQAIQALASNPLVMSLTKAEAIFDEMAAAHRQYIPGHLSS